ncbi:hypothetical protein ACFW04_002486 [Cataglyphis niger]
MIRLNVVLLVLCLIYPLVNGVGFRGFTFQGLEEPVPLKKYADKDVIEGWITQPLDHFNYRDNRTWLMRYKENSAFLRENSSILIMLGGEWEISNGFLQGGLMYEIGSKYKALMYYTEHRYYGKSKPTKDISTENLQYLNVDQALADLAYFIETKKKEKNLEKSTVIVFGGSYAGNMAAWARLKYPHLIQVFASTVQYDNVVNGQTKIAALCNTMTAAHLGSPLQRLARVVSKPDVCLDVNYNNFVEKYRDISWNSSVIQSSMRQWYHQTCTEYGYYQTTSSDKSIFGTLFPLSFYIDMCTDLYGDYFNDKILDSRVRRTNIMYGGQLPDLTNVIFTNGDIDPWHSLSVLENLNTFSPAIVIKGSSHCRDIYSDEVTDLEDLKKARARIREIISKWISL